MSRSKADLNRNRGALSREASRTALFGTDDDSEFLSLDLEQVYPRADQVRQYFDDQALQELAESIAQHGVFQPIIVREVRPDHFQIIAGERRWRASKIAGKTQIPALSIKTDDPDLIAFLENIQRADLDAFEEAKGLARLIANRKEKGQKITHEQLGKIAGKSQTYVTRALKILELPQRIADEYQKREHNRLVPITMLMEIASLGDEDAQIDMWERAKAGLTVAAARKEKQGRVAESVSSDPVAKAIRSTTRIAATLGKLRTSGVKLDEQQREHLQRLRQEIDSILEQ